MSSIIFETARTYVRAWDPLDIDQSVPIYMDSEVMSLVQSGRPLTHPQVKTLILDRIRNQEQGRFCFWAWVMKGTNEVIGHCGIRPAVVTREDSKPLPPSGLSQYPGKQIEIGYLLARKFWGQGLATEGARGALQFGFGIPGLEHLVAVTNPKNDRSIHVLRKTGMKDEGFALYDGRRLRFFSAVRYA